MAIEDKLLIMARNWADSGTYAASTQETNFPIDNLKTEPRKKTWRATSIANQYIDLDIGDSGDLVNAICFINHNSTPDGRWSLYGHSAPTIFPGTPESASFQLTDQYFVPATVGAGELGAGLDGAGGVPDRQQINMMNKVIFKTFDQQELRYWHITFSDPTNTDGYLELGRLFLGYATQPDINFDWGNELNLVDPSIQRTTAGGGVVTDVRNKFRRKTIKCKYATDGEKYFMFMDSMQNIGKSGNAVISFYPKEESTGRLFETIYGKFEKIGAIKQKALNTNEFSFTFRELV